MNHSMQDHLLVVWLSVAVWVPAHLYADCSTPGGLNNNTSLDNSLIGYACDNSFIAQAWDWYDFDKDYWDNGFGYHDPCNLNRPLARTFNPMYLLKRVNYYWYDWSSDKIDELLATCDSSPIATYWDYWIFDEFVELHQPFFFNINVVQRAGTIVHESRHYDKSHDADDSECLRLGSCDSRWSYNGANTFEIKYLRDLFCSPDPFVTTTMRQYAKDMGNALLVQSFKHTPSFAFTDTGFSCGDTDSDLIPDTWDNCINTQNLNQLDSDNDSAGDACDNCPGVVNAHQADSDGDGHGNECDNCVNAANPNQANSDGDRYGNACDNCPTMVNNSQEDLEGDGIGDVCDADWDNDSATNSTDNCPKIANPGQEDEDGDGLGNVCDNCPTDINADQSDNDCDGIGDACDVAQDYFGCKGGPPEAYDPFWWIKDPSGPLVYPVERIRIQDNVSGRNKIHQ